MASLRLFPFVGRPRTSGRSEGCPDAVHLTIGHTAPKTLSRSRIAGLAIHQWVSMKAIVTDAKTSADFWPAPDFRERNTLTYGFHSTRLHLFVVASIGSVYLYTIQQIGWERFYPYSTWLSVVLRVVAAKFQRVLQYTVMGESDEK
jgi:hypothetical protein